MYSFSLQSQLLRLADNADTTGLFEWPILVLKIEKYQKFQVNSTIESYNLTIFDF